VRDGEGCNLRALGLIVLGSIAFWLALLALGSLLLGDTWDLT